MGALEDDIARIAALRGKPANYYQVQKSEREIPGMWLDNLFTMPPTNGFRDLRANDALPRSVRRVINELSIPVNAAICGDILELTGSEERLLSLVSARAHSQMYHHLLRHYGRDHPNLRKYA